MSSAPLTGLTGGDLEEEQSSAKLPLPAILAIVAAGVGLVTFLIVWMLHRRGQTRRQTAARRYAKERNMGQIG